VGIEGYIAVVHTAAIGSLCRMITNHSKCLFQHIEHKVEIDSRPGHIFGLLYGQKPPTPWGSAPPVIVRESTTGTFRPREENRFVLLALREHHVDSLTSCGAPCCTTAVSNKKRKKTLRRSGIKIQSITVKAKGSRGPQDCESCNHQGSNLHSGRIYTLCRPLGHPDDW
jgi:hypothetical protein